MPPLVSCVMSCYQHAPYLRRALDSLLAVQDPGGGFEVIVIDDGSDDGSGDIVASYGDRVRYVWKENAGIRDTVDVMLREAGGELIAFFAGDDETPPDKLVRQVAVMRERPEVGLCYGDMEAIDGQGNVIAQSFMAACGLTGHDGRILGPLLERNFVSGGSIMVRASLRDRFFPLPERAAWEDWWIAQRVAEVAELAYVPEPVARYRLHGQNLVFGATGPKLISLLRREVDFRRFQLITLDLSSVGAAEILPALGAMFGVVGKITSETQSTVEDVAPDRPGDRDHALEELARVRGALEAGDTDEAARAMARVAGWSATTAVSAGDPALTELRAAMDAARKAHEALDPARAQIVLAFADELVADGDLLRAWGAAVTGADDVTLAVLAPGWEPDRLMAELGAVVAAAGLDGPDAADLLAVLEPLPPAAARAVAGRARGVLTERPVPEAFGYLQRGHAGEVDRLVAGR
jgi:hypothetical protein